MSVTDTPASGKEFKFTALYKTIFAVIVIH